MRSKTSIPRKFDPVRSEKAKNFVRPGNPFFTRALCHYHRRDPPPVQAVGDTIPKGLYSVEWRPFFVAQLFVAQRKKVSSRSLLLAQGLFIDCIFTVDLAADCIGNRDHSLIVFKYPTYFGAR